MGPSRGDWLDVPLEDLLRQDAARTSDRGGAPGVTTDLILRSARITTLNRIRPEVGAPAVKDGRFVAAGEEQNIMSLAGPVTQVIDGGGQRAVPGLINMHIHVIRGRLNCLMELHWVACRHSLTRWRC